MCHLVSWEAESWHKSDVWHPFCGSLEGVCVATCVAAMPPAHLRPEPCSVGARFFKDGCSQLVMLVRRHQEALCPRQLMRYF